MVAGIAPVIAAPSIPRARLDTTTYPASANPATNLRASLTAAADDGDTRAARERTFAASHQDGRRSLDFLEQRGATGRSVEQLTSSGAAHRGHLVLDPPHRCRAIVAPAARGAIGQRLQRLWASPKRRSNCA
jgi:hypothetical protein